ncbi:hypothetical protein Y032_1106g3613 [Ancylostoma ceylanicum]|nr:hypothetical protein Y032_1106g3613 [Ancylostoma ceylanicum]
MEDGIVSKEVNDHSTTSRSCDSNGSDVSQSFEEQLPGLSKSASECDMIFDGEESEERGDHVVGAEFICTGLEVVWLNNTDLDASSTGKERYNFNCVYCRFSLEANTELLLSDLSSGEKSEKKHFRNLAAHIRNDADGRGVECCTVAVQI